MGKGLIQEKPIEFLINSIKEKLSGTEVPKYCWLIGAGCSVRSGIPTGTQLIKLLKMEIYKREHIADKVGFEIKPPFDYKNYEDDFNKHILEKSLNGNYEQFIKKHEAQIQKDVDNFRKKIL